MSLNRPPARIRDGNAYPSLLNPVTEDHSPRWRGSSDRRMPQGDEIAQSRLGSETVNPLPPLQYSSIPDQLSPQRSTFGASSCSPASAPFAGSVQGDQIPSILARLHHVEQRLDSIAPIQTQHSGISALDIADMQSRLVPAAQGGARGRTYSQHTGTTPSGATPVYDDRHQTQKDVMESLCLRRDLSPPEDPPFGMWWAYTVEEVLLWPILEYQGSVNRGLDVVMLGSEGDSDIEDDHEDEEDQNTFRSPNESRREIPQSSTSPHHSIDHSTDMTNRRGLDDGTVVPGLISSFLKNVHTKCPMLNPGQLQAHAANMIEDGLDWGAKTCQVLLACALGAISSPWVSEELNDYATHKPSNAQRLIAQEYYQAGQKRLGPLYTRASLTSAQCLFMAGTYFMYIQRPVAGWRMLNAASIACRAYISKKVAKETLGIRHNSSRSMEQRLYWSCFNTEREVACEFGMETAGLNAIVHSTMLPTPPNSSATDRISDNSVFLGLDNAQTPSASMVSQDKSWYFFLTDIMLRKLEMRIDNYTQEKRREAYRRAGESPESFYQSLYEANQEFGYQLTSYYESLPPIMQFSLDELTPCSDELRQYLKWRVSSVRHDICTPSFYALISNDVSQWNKGLVDGLIADTNVMLRLDVAFLWAASSTYRDRNTWLALRKGIRAGLVLIAARKLKAQNRPELAALEIPDDETCRRGAQALVRALQYWQSELRDCATNLEILRSLHPDFRAEGDIA